MSEQDKKDNVPVISLHFTDKDCMNFYDNGDIYLRGKIVENDKEVVDGLRQFLKITNSSNNQL